MKIGADHGTNQDNVFTAAQLSQVTYKAGSGTDTLWVRVNDGSGFGPWSTPFTVSDPPQVQTVQPGETLDVASPFSGSVTFAGATGTLKLDDSASFSATVAGMTGQDTIDFADIDPNRCRRRAIPAMLPAVRSTSPTACTRPTSR
jgi:hypothetical protein